VGPKIGLLFLLAANAALGQTPLTLQVNVEPAAQGAPAHVKVFAPAPIALSSGGFSLSFTGGAYPSTAPAITGLTVFSVTADAEAVSGVTGDAFFHPPYGFGVSFFSPAAGVGRVPGLPLFEFSLTITQTVTVQVTGNAFGPFGAYTLSSSVTPIAVAGGLSLQGMTADTGTSLYTFPRQSTTGGTCARRFPIEANAPAFLQFQNPGAEAAQVTVTNAFPSGTKTVSVAPNGTLQMSIVDPANSSFQSSAPVRAICYYLMPHDPNVSDIREFPPLTLIAAAPVIGWLGNAANQESGAVAPNEIVTFFGAGFGNEPPQLTFDGVEARVLYASDSQINAIVPAGLAGRSESNVQLANANGVAQWTNTMAVAAPAIFGVLNQDNSLNGNATPAARGSVVQIFATGAGNGLSASVTIGGENAEVLYAGQAPGAVDGLFQVNAVIPRGVSGVAALVLAVDGSTASFPIAVE